MDALVNDKLPPLGDAALDLVFRKARTFNYFLDIPVDDAVILEAVRLAEFGPTAVNSLPGRFLVVRSPDARARLAKHLSEGNRAKTIAAPLTVVAAYDTSFPQTLLRTFPQAPAAQDWFAGPAAETAAAKNGTLQTAYFILAARSLGLDAGPMGGFDAAGVDGEFFAGTTWRSNLVINLGYGDRARLHPRNPRFEPEEITRFV